ncbi:uncharacterized protein BYT42DRAFT_120120 [Radiomyces spectabilis]|uniref:uncharacterized protein n=1 Tax=Radiomyces spectabilis TaxID=64574 RepID=UPI00221EF5B0|nr:uncharacterized protein BYT42DRAFT_120120 [Radiomyces spectabilis]KAI8368159.1 hypothetical protein BYT42DRAFT_120120 [Radiomyces spectabilis]
MTTEEIITIAAVTEMIVILTMDVQVALQETVANIPVPPDTEMNVIIHAVTDMTVTIATTVMTVLAVVEVLTIVMTTVREEAIDQRILLDRGLDELLIGTEEDRQVSTTIFAGNIPYAFRERDIASMFERYGRLAKVTVPMDAITGKNKGFSFIEFEDRRDAEDAFDKFQGFSVEGRRLKLDWDIGLSKKDEHRGGVRAGDDTRSSRPLPPPPPPLPADDYRDRK